MTEKVTTDLLFEIYWGYQPSPEESNVDDGGESIEKLENEGLEDESFLKTLVGFRDL